MEKFRDRLALPVTRLTQNFPSPTILPESSGRNRCIQQMAHFVPNRCHTPYWSGSWATVSPDFEDHLVPGAVHSWIMWGFGNADTLTVTAHPGHFNSQGEPREEETLAVENVQVEQDTSGSRMFFDVRNVGSFAVFGYVIGFGMVSK